jgi:hypothetical protein
LIKRDGIHLINLNKEIIGGKKIKEASSINESVVETLKQNLEEKVKDEKKIYLISNEGLSGLPYDYYKNSKIIAELLRYATRSFEVKIIVSLRRQDDFIQSLYMQSVHEGLKLNKRALDIENFISHPDLDNLDWNSFLKPYEDNFGKYNVHAYPYDREVLKEYSITDLLNNSIKSNFLKKVEDSPSANIAFSPQIHNLLQSLDADLTSYQRKILRRTIHNKANKGRFTENKILNDDTKKELFNQFKESNEALAQKYFKPFNLDNFSYPLSNQELNLGKKEYEEYVEIIKGLLEKNELAELKKESLKPFLRKVKNSVKKLIN